MRQTAQKSGKDSTSTHKLLGTAVKHNCLGKAVTDPKKTNSFLVTAMEDWPFMAKIFQGLFEVLEAVSTQLHTQRKMQVYPEPVPHILSNSKGWEFFHCPHGKTDYSDHGTKIGGFGSFLKIPNIPRVSPEIWAKDQAQTRPWGAREVSQDNF